MLISLHTAPFASFVHGVHTTHPGQRCTSLHFVMMTNLGAEMVVMPKQDCQRKTVLLDCWLLNFKLPATSRSPWDCNLSTWKKHAAPFDPCPCRANIASDLQILACNTSRFVLSTASQQTPGIPYEHCDYALISIDVHIKNHNQSCAAPMNVRLLPMTALWGSHDTKHHQALLSKVWSFDINSVNNGWAAASAKELIPEPPKTD